MVLPLIMLRNVLERQLRGGDEDKPDEMAEEEILAAVSLGSAMGQIDETERSMIESVLALGDASVDRLMTPRTDMHAIDAEASVC